MNRERVDVAAVRAAHPLADVVAAAGVELRRSGHGFMGCCPFHDDTTASLSVEGVPDRFHCFGCGASGDVIDFVQRLHGLSFPDAVARLDGTTPQTRHHLHLVHETPHRTAEPDWPSPDRAYDINALAWTHYTRPVGHATAVSHLRRRRGIDVTALENHLDRTVVGHTGHGWTTLTDHLRELGVIDEELLALDLAQRTRRGSLIDTLRDRLVVPATTPDGRIAGLIGRDTSGEPAAPKYRNPTRTVTYDKATTCYQPGPAQHPQATLVLVEGPLDALAVAATAATAHRLDDFTALATGGVAVTAAHAAAAARLTQGRFVVAMDGDPAGREGATRWVDQLMLRAGLPVLVAHLHNQDPADWLARVGPVGLSLFDPTQHGTPCAPLQPGPEIVRAVLRHRSRDPIGDVSAALQPFLASLPADQADALAARAVDEMTRQGWNPDDALARALNAARPPAARAPLRLIGPSL